MNATNEPLIQLQDLKKVFYTDEVETHALAGIHLTIDRGEYVAISGPSGCGKTTLLRLMTGQILPDQGSILIEGRDVCRMRRKELYETRKRIGMLFQNGALLTDINVYENVAFPLREHRTAHCRPEQPVLRRWKWWRARSLWLEA
mgnify:CR=1 FL=1